MILPRDPAVLVSVLNTKLRDFYASLDELCDDLEADKTELENSCAAAGYSYSAERNRFV